MHLVDVQASLSCSLLVKLVVCNYDMNCLFCQCTTRPSRASGRQAETNAQTLKSNSGGLAASAVPIAVKPTATWRPG